MLNWIRQRRQRRELAARLLDALVEQAREPSFYTEFGVPDTMLGRYEMVCLHAYVLFRGMKRGNGRDAALAQTLHDLIFDDFDIALREAGVGDMGIGKRVKKLARNLHGRISAYERALAAGDDAMAAALRRNLYASADPTDGQVAAMIAYVRAARSGVDSGRPENLRAARLSFPDPAGVIRALRGGAA